MDAIYDIKNSQAAGTRGAITADLVMAAERLISRGARAIIAGCTEIPITLRQEQLLVPYFDCLSILAHAAIRRAGLDPAGAIGSAREQAAASDTQAGRGGRKTMHPA